MAGGIEQTILKRCNRKTSIFVFLTHCQRVGDIHIRRSPDDKSRGVPEAELDKQGTPY